ncbi:MAG TPA: YggT family protein [Acidimicrobiia bacterium]|nr:YggT family protein [Acidimicrobiia bacterium]
MAHILHLLIGVYLVVLLARAVSSWFPPPAHGSPFTIVLQIVHDLTEPLLAPLRRVIPPAGMFDLSFTVLFFILIILFQIIR